MNQVYGFRELDQRLARAVRETPAIVGGALYLLGSDIMGDSKELVPLDYGVLRASGRVLPPEVSGATITVALGYGGAASDYAWRQHEEEDWRHSGGRQAHYLSEPVEARENDFTARLAQTVDRLLR